jgi:hypothetical protein
LIETRLGQENLRQLDTSNGCQDHTALPYAATSTNPSTVRVQSAEILAEALKRRSSCALHDRSRKTALRSQSRPTLPRPPHPAPTFVTMANAPVRDGMAGL